MINNIGDMYALFANVPSVGDRDNGPRLPAPLAPTREESERSTCAWVTGFWVGLLLGITLCTLILVYGKNRSSDNLISIDDSKNLHAMYKIFLMGLACIVPPWMGTNIATGIVEAINLRRRRLAAPGVLFPAPSTTLHRVQPQPDETARLIQPLPPNSMV